MVQEVKNMALDTKLEAYAKCDVYPFHMPGHKRSPLAMPNPYTIDITEIDGFDNLHQAEGIIKEAEARAAKLYGAERSYYLINGSTCGLLAAISAAVPVKGRLLLARNAHKVVYHAAYLRMSAVTYLNPCVTEFGIQGAVDPDEVKQKLREDPKIAAVVITSPTYEGIVSDIAAIAGIVHAYQIPLIVDEAHGAHFGFHRMFPETAVRLGADVVIQSMHKVLPSLTQTALLHLQSEYIDSKILEKFLGIYQTSSPSYVLMAGMEKCIRLLKEQGEMLFESYAGKLMDFYRKAERFSKIHLMNRSDFNSGELYDLDASKLVISVKHTTMTGNDLYQNLLRRHHLQLEMFSGFYALGMTSIMDREEGFHRLFSALEETERDAVLEEQDGQKSMELIRKLYAPKKKRAELYQAMELPIKRVSFQEAAGRVSGSMISLYSPGIPILLPGEIIEEDFLKNILKCPKFQLNLQGIADIMNEKIDIAIL